HPRQEVDYGEGGRQEVAARLAACDHRDARHEDDRDRAGVREPAGSGANLTSGQRAYPPATRLWVSLPEEPLDARPLVSRPRIPRFPKEEHLHAAHGNRSVETRVAACRGVTFDLGGEENRHGWMDDDIRGTRDLQRAWKGDGGRRASEDRA